MKDENYPQRQSAPTGAQELETKQEADRPLGDAACSFLSSSEWLWLENEGLGRIELVRASAIKSVGWDMDEPFRLRVDLGNGYFTLASDSALRLLGLLGLGDHVAVESWRETLRETELDRGPSHLQQPAEPPCPDAGTRMSQLAQGRIHPPEDPLSNGWTLV